MYVYTRAFEIDLSLVYGYERFVLYKVPARREGLSKIV